MLTLALAFCSFTPPPEVPRCYVVLFGGQADRYRPSTAHTWATFARGGPGGLDAFTISWLPVTMPVRPLRLRPEPGRNYGLQETLGIFRTGREKIGLWGPFEIQPCWFDEAITQLAFLDSGAVQYNVLDRGPWRKNAPLRRPDISHCVHAVSRTNASLSQESRPVFTVGELITRKVAAKMDEVGLLVHPEVKHDWLLPAIGVNGDDFTRRNLGEPILKVLR